MSFQRLHNVSARYTNGPITARRFSDETDTESVTSSQSDSVASSDSGSVVSDDGTESGSLIGHDARDLRRRHAQARVNNTLQYAHGRINDGVRPVQGLANGVAQGGDSFYHGVARPFFDEVLFKIRVTCTVIVRLLFLLVWYSAELPVRFVWYLMDLARRAFWSALNLIDASIWYVLDLANASFWFTIDMAQSSFGILRQAFIATSASLRDLLRDVQWWMWKPIAILLVAFIILIVMPFISVLHGFTSMATYLCSDTSISRGWTAFPEICKHSNINAVLSIENTELLKLTAPSDAILTSVRDLLESGKHTPPSRNELLRESTAVKEFAWLHQDDLAKFPFSRTHNISVIAEAIHGNATIFNTALDNFSSHHRDRVEELELKTQQLLDDANNFRPHSPFQRGFSETLCYYFPSLFGLSSVARRNSRYLSMATHFPMTPEAKAIPQHAVEISQSAYNIAHDLAIAQDALRRYEPFLTLACDTKEISGAKCHQTPTELAAKLEAAFARAQTSAAGVAKAYALHDAAASSLEALRGELGRSVDIAAGKSTPARGEVSAAAARAVLHRFWVRMKVLGVVLGSGPVEKTFDEGSHPGSRFFVGEDGVLSTHSLHPQWTGI
jgi:hypothetical protein